MQITAPANPGGAEEWRPVLGYEGLYEVSSTGKVRSLDRIGTMSNGVRRRYRGRALAPGISNKGYQYVILCRDGQEKTATVHRLVALAFLPAPTPGLIVCHNNGDPMDNRVENLRWDTYSGNENDVVAHGNHQFATRTHCPRSHPLALPNLVPSALKKGHRNCLACERARGYLRWHKLPQEYLKPVSDRYFAQLMTTEEVLDVAA